MCVVPVVVGAPVLPGGGTVRGVAERDAPAAPDVVVRVDGPQAPALPLQAVHRGGQGEFHAHLAEAAGVRAVPGQDYVARSGVGQVPDGVAHPHQACAVDADLEGDGDRGVDGLDIDHGFVALEVDAAGLRPVFRDVDAGAQQLEMRSARQDGLALVDERGDLSGIFAEAQLEVAAADHGLPLILLQARGEGCHRGEAGRPGADGETVFVHLQSGRVDEGEFQRVSRLQVPHRDAERARAAGSGGRTAQGSLLPGRRPAYRQLREVRMAEAVLQLHGEVRPGSGQVQVAPRDAHRRIGLAQEPYLGRVVREVAEEAELVQAQRTVRRPGALPGVQDAFAPEIAHARVSGQFLRGDAHVVGLVDQDGHLRAVRPLVQQGRRVPDGHAVAGEVRTCGGIMEAVDIVGNLLVGADAVGPAEHRGPLGIIGLDIAVRGKDVGAVEALVAQAPHDDRRMVPVALELFLHQREPLVAVLRVQLGAELGEVDAVLVQDIHPGGVRLREEGFRRPFLARVVDVEPAQLPGGFPAPEAAELDFPAVDQQPAAAELDRAEAIGLHEGLRDLPAGVREAEGEVIEVGVLGIPLAGRLDLDLVFEFVHPGGQPDAGGRDGQCLPVRADGRQAEAPAARFGHLDPDFQFRVTVLGIEGRGQAQALQVLLRDGVQAGFPDHGLEAHEGAQAVAALQPDGDECFLARGHKVRDIRRPGTGHAPVVPHEMAVDAQAGGLGGVVEAQDDAPAGECGRDLHGPHVQADAVAAGHLRALPAVSEADHRLGDPGDRRGNGHDHGAFPVGVGLYREVLCGRRQGEGCSYHTREDSTSHG